MRKFIPVLLVAAVTLPISAFSADQSNERSGQRAEAVQTLSRGFDKAGADEDARVAEMAGVRGDWAMSASLAARSYKEKPDIWNEFNLATAYQRTGQGAKAVPLYLDLVDRGQFTRTREIDSFDGEFQQPMLPNLADESALRLNRMGTAANSGAPTAAAFQDARNSPVVVVTR